MPGSLFDIVKLDVLALEPVEIESRFFFFFKANFKWSLVELQFVLLFIWELVLCQGCAVLPMVACEGLCNLGARGASRNCLF